MKFSNATVSVDTVCLSESLYDWFETWHKPSLGASSHWEIIDNKGNPSLPYPYSLQPGQNRDLWLSAPHVKHLIGNPCLHDQLLWLISPQKTQHSLFEFKHLHRSGGQLRDHGSLNETLCWVWVFRGWLIQDDAHSNKLHTGELQI